MKITKNISPQLKFSVERLAVFSLLFISSLTIGSIYFIPQIQTQYNLRQFLPRQNELLENDSLTRTTFQLPETQPFIATATLTDKNTKWLSPEKIKILEGITNELAQLPNVSGTLSIAVASGAIVNKSELMVGKLLSNTPSHLWEKTIRKSTLLTPNLISRDLKTVGILVNIPPLNSSQLEKLRFEIEDAMRRQIPFAKIHIGGSPAVQTDVSQLLQGEVRNFVSLALIACIFVLILVFENITPVLISLTIIFCSNVIVLGVMAMAGKSFSMLSTTIPIVTSIDVLSLCIHTFLRFSEEHNRFPLLTHNDLIAKIFKSLLVPNLIASTTTVIGFFALLEVNAPLIRDFGITASIAVTIGWLVTTSMLFPIMYFTKPPKARSWAWKKATWSLPILKHSRITVVTILFFSILLVYKGQDLSWTAHLFDDLPQGHPVRISTVTIDQEMGGMVPLDIVIEGAPETWSDPKRISNLNKLCMQYRKIPEVGSVSCLPDLISASNLTQSKLPQNSGSLAEIYFLYSLSNESPLKNYLNANSSTTRIAVRFKDISSMHLLDLEVELKKMAIANFSGLKITSGGMGATIHKLNNELSKELIFGFWQSMVAIGILLLVIFRSIRWAVVACIPNLIPPAFLMGFLALSKTPIKPGVAIIFSIALGLAFNNTVYLLERLRQFQRQSFNNKINIRKTILREGNACLISSLTLLAGFTVFLASYFNMNKIFGAYMMLSMLAGIIGDLILLPALLNYWPWLLNPVSLKKEKVMTVAASIIMFLFFGFFPNDSFAGTDIKQIGEELSKRLSSQDEQFTAQIKIIEADNSNKMREMKIWRRSPEKNEHSLLVRLQKPLDLRGTSLLAILEGETENKWLYLPSSKQTRRLSGESSHGGILGSELSMEDFDFDHQKGGAQNFLKKELLLNGKKYFLIESQVQKTSPTYSKVFSYVSAENFLPIKVECYDKKGHLLKILELSDYKKVSDKKWRVGKIKIRNVQNKRGTEILISQVRLNQNLRKGLFSPQALSQE